MKYWEERDPLTRFEQYLLNEKHITSEQIDEWTKKYKNAINDGLDTASAKALPQSSPEQELADVFAPHKFTPVATSNTTTNIRLIDAIKDGLEESMNRYDDLVIMGQDVAEYGGVFKITDGFLEKYGKERVRNTPICESAIVEAGMGLSLIHI